MSVGSSEAFVAALAGSLRGTDTSRARVGTLDRSCALRGVQTNPPHPRTKGGLRLPVHPLARAGASSGSGGWLHQLGQYAAKVGRQKGDIIMAVNTKKIAKTSDLDKASREQVRLWRITLVRGGQEINVTLGG